MSYARIVKGGEQQHKAGWKRATDRMASFLDDIEMKSDMWQKVQRTKWNSEYAMPFYGPEVCDFEITRSSKIGSSEKVLKRREPGFWERQWDLAGVKRFALALLSYFDKMNQDERIERKYKELEQAMGGPDAIRKMGWPVVLILASKK